MGKKISFAFTVFNEEKNVALLLKSILSQSVLPDEIVVADAGSTDGTVAAIKRVAGGKVKIKVIVEKRATIGRGRNIAIQNCSGDLIFSADASTEFERDWVKKLLIGFEKGADIVVGKYLPAKPSGLIERVAASRFPNFDSFSDADWNSFLPSNRQIAYKKSVWQKVGKFPEKFSRSDDTIFHLTAKKLGLKYYFAKDARVFWTARQSLWEYVEKAFLDSESDAIAGILFRRRIEQAQMAAFAVVVASIAAGIAVDARLSAVALLVFLLVFLRESVRGLKKAGAIVAIAGGFVGIALFLAHALGSTSGIAKSALGR